MPKVQVFDAANADYHDLRVGGGGSQRICEWITPAEGHHNSIGVAELRNIRIADYRFGFSDFLFVLDGAVMIIEEPRRYHLTPRQAILIPEGAVITIEVSDLLRWLYVSDPGNWRDLLDTPGSVAGLS